MRDKSKAKAWLFTTLYREFLHGRRKAKRLVAFDDLPPDEQEMPDVGVDLVSKIDSKQVLTALREIDPICREPLTLFYLQDLFYRETARILAVPLGTVMSRLHRGKIQLRALLVQDCRVPEAA